MWGGRSGRAAKGRHSMTLRIAVRYVLAFLLGIVFVYFYFVGPIPSVRSRVVFYSVPVFFSAVFLLPVRILGTALIGAARAVLPPRHPDHAGPVARRRVLKGVSRGVCLGLGRRLCHLDPSQGAASHGGTKPGTGDGSGARELSLSSGAGCPRIGVRGNPCRNCQRRFRPAPTADTFARASPQGARRCIAPCRCSPRNRTAAA